GDGYSDIIAGAPEYTNNQTQEGRAYVFFGSSSGPSAGYDWTYEDNTANAWFGISVCTAGDINGDGFSDVIVGMPLAGNGAAFVFIGFAAGLASSPNWSNENNQAGSEQGYSVSIAGDVNGDGYSDVIVGAPFYDNGQTDEGRAYAYYGSLSGLSTTPDWTKEINEDSAQFGFAVSTAGDINGDGYSDVILSANLFNGVNYTDQGRVYVYNGSSSGLSGSPSWNKTGQQDNAHFGSSVSTAGDINGDGFSDIIVGSDNFNSGQSGEGKVFVYYGTSSGLTSNEVWTAEGDQTDANFGNSVSSSDVNGDGYSDIIVGAYKFDNGQADEGAVFLYYGSAYGLPLTQNIMLESDQASAQFGFSVSTAGDVNADSYFDIIIGANLYDNGENNEGRAYIYNGSSSGISSTPAITLELNQGGEKFGSSVCNAGDVNGDGYSDVIISAPDYDNGQSNEGRVYLYYGSPDGIPANSVWFYEPDQANADFGFSISTAGDVNGDGYSDIIIGSPLQNNGQADEGMVFVFYGNLATCQRANVRQFDNGTGNVICSGNNTGTNGGVRHRIYANSPYGRADGTIAFERKRTGNAFSGTIITKSTDFNNSGTYEDLSFNGKNINYDVNGLNSSNEFRWRARVMFDPVNNPYQKFGPWKYFNNYIPIPSGDFRPRVNTAAAPSLTLNALIQGFYNSSTDLMVRDTVTVYVREYFSPFTVLDSAKFYLSTSGSATMSFSNTGILNGAMYYLEVKHRNSIETWNKGSAFVNGSQTFDFTQTASSAYGNNELQVNSSPVKFAVYGGDEDQNGLVDLNDVINVYNATTAFATGYIRQDMNGDNIADLSDVLITYNNANAFVSRIIP
ncbi:MAG TPA: integrin alpha, partial [Ignavibacteria bacterium]|nr:integrin alpha [Ignavibacteria bacterium]HMR41408.1 integrin alpha [Ignavibacteria bacterium]